MAGPGLIGVRLAPTVLLADADPDARAMVQDALLEGTGPADLRTVETAAELEEYLDAEMPALILIDLGDEQLDAVRSIKSNSDRRHIPVVVLARTLTPELTGAAYDAGANTVIPKPVTFLALVKLMKVFTAYWLEAAALPPERA